MLRMASVLGERGVSTAERTELTVLDIDTHLGVLSGPFQSSISASIGRPSLDKMT